MPVTQNLAHGALAGRRFASFASKTVDTGSAHPVGVLTQFRPHGQLSGRRFTSFASKTPSSGVGGNLISAAYGTPTGSSTATVGCTTDTASGTVYAAITTSSTPPSAVDIKAGLGAVWYGSGAVSSVSPSLSATGLTAATNYYVHLVQTISAVDSNVISSSLWVTDNPGSGSIGIGALPVISGAYGTPVTSTTATVGCDTDTAAGTLYAAITSTATTPSAADIKAGTGATWFGSVSVASITPTLSATGLGGASNYYVHFVQTVSGIDSAPISSAQFTTPATSGAGAHPVGVLTQHYAFGVISGARYGDFSGKGGVTVTQATAQTGAGRSRKRRPDLVVTIDGEDFPVASEAEAVALLEEVRKTAEQQAKTVLERAASTQNRPKRKVLADARKSLVAPSISVPEILQESAANTIAQIESLYNSAIQTVEIGAYLRKQAEMDEEDAILLLMLA